MRLPVEERGGGSLRPFHGQGAASLSVERAGRLASDVVHPQEDERGASCAASFTGAGWLPRQGKGGPPNGGRLASSDGAEGQAVQRRTARRAGHPAIFWREAHGTPSCHLGGRQRPRPSLREIAAGMGTLAFSS